MELNEDFVATLIFLGLSIFPPVPMLWAMTSKRVREATHSVRVRWAASLGLVSHLWLSIPSILDVDRRFEDYVIGPYGSCARVMVLGGNALLQAVLAVVVSRSDVRGRWLLVAAHATSALYWGFIFAIQGAV